MPFKRDSHLSFLYVFATVATVIGMIVLVFGYKRAIVLVNDHMKIPLRSTFRLDRGRIRIADDEDQEAGTEAMANAFRQSIESNRSIRQHDLVRGAGEPGQVVRCDSGEQVVMLRMPESMEQDMAADLYSNEDPKKTADDLRRFDQE